MEDIKIKSKAECKWDEVSLGEVMLRLDPGDGRVKTTRQFRAYEGGGEYNVARGLRRCFNMKTAIITSLPKNDVGALVEDLMLQGGVDLSYLDWKDFDGIGRNTRVGINFTEKGYGIRAALGVSDRANTAVSQLKVGDVDFDKIFKEDGARWFHTGGIFAGLSDTTPEFIIEAVKKAKENGTVVSYDLNFRASLWKSNGGKEKAQEINREIAKYVDVMIGNEEDFSASLGFHVEGMDEDFSKLDTDNFKKMIEKVVTKYPNFKAVATTLRNAKTATYNDWGAILYYKDKLHQAVLREDLEIYDRVGGGDSFASGLIYGFLTGKTPEECVNYGATHGALAMTTPGDTTMASLAEVEKALKGGGARVDR